ncbi:MAG: SoxR reducing system RseC family protein [Deltaproteobacteria bacterium]|jgi:positive regulator of sigma E activity|nr:SoxR reducing system RseC family protein [Deltaproteobacteria bacterium]
MSSECIIEYGKVISSQDAVAEVQINRPEACDNCPGKNACHTLSGGKIHKARVHNLCNCQPGDLVKIEIPADRLLFSAFLVYFFPAVSLLTGAIIGHFNYEITPFSRDLASVIFGISTFAISVLIVFLFNHFKNETILPRAVEIITSAKIKPDSSDETP